MSMDQNLNKFLEELIQEVEKELDEMTGTGAVGGYNTPAAFSDGGAKDKKRKKKISTQFGMKIVGKMDEDSVNEGKYDGVLDKIEDLVSKAKSFMDVGNQLKKQKIKYSFSTSIMPIYRLDKLPIAIVNKRYAKPNTAAGDRVVGDMVIGLMESMKMNEAKVKRPVNRWLELKNDETMHPHKKMAMGLKELKYQLRETEKFFNWYNKIKTMNELDSNQYWKRTNNHIYKIKERLINIARTIQEIEK